MHSISSGSGEPSITLAGTNKIQYSCKLKSWRALWLRIDHFHPFINLFFHNSLSVSRQLGHNELQREQREAFLYFPPLEMKGRCQKLLHVGSLRGGVFIIINQLHEGLFDLACAVQFKDNGNGGALIKWQTVVIFAYSSIKVKKKKKCVPCLQDPHFTLVVSAVKNRICMFLEAEMENLDYAELSLLMLKAIDL